MPTSRPINGTVRLGRRRRAGQGLPRPEPGAGSAGPGAASGLPWYAIMVLPLLFACGMSLLDCLDGLFMSVACDWAFLNPVRKVCYNISITGLSVAVAFLVGTIELVSVLHDDAGWVNPVTAWISGIDLSNVGFIVAGLFAAAWAVALG